MGFANNTLSPVFPYLLYGRMCTKPVLFDEIDSHAGWSGCYWVLYEPREGIKFGINGFGNMDLILTYIDSDVSPSASDMDRLAEEIAAYGKPTDPRLIARLTPYGLVNDDGDLPFPMIQNGPRPHSLAPGCLHGCQGQSPPAERGSLLCAGRVDAVSRLEPRSIRQTAPPAHRMEPPSAPGPPLPTERHCAQDAFRQKSRSGLSIFQFNTYLCGPEKGLTTN